MFVQRRRKHLKKQLLSQLSPPLAGMEPRLRSVEAEEVSEASHPETEAEAGAILEVEAVPTEAPGGT